MKTERFHIQITRVGWLFFSLSIAVGIAALNSGNNLLYLIFGMMMSFIILSGLLSNNTLKGISLRFRFPRRIFAKQTLPAQLQVLNQKNIFPSFALSLKPQCSYAESKESAFFVKIPSHHETSSLLKIRFLRRGKHFFPTFRLETSYPFGLLKKYQLIPSSEETVVYPELLTWNETSTREHSLPGDFLSGQKGGSSNPYGIRNYQHGDPTRFIHWKTSAKRGEWVVKEFEKEKKMKVWIELHLAPQPISQPNEMEKAISLAATLVVQLSSMDYEVILSINGEVVHPKGKGYVDAYLTALSFAQPLLEFPSLSFHPEEEAVILITDLPQNQVRASAWKVLAKEQLDQRV